MVRHSMQMIRHDASPMTVMPWIYGVVLLGMTAVTTWAEGAEIELRSECECTGPVVCLGDVARVLSADAKEVDQLSRIELMPVPSVGREQFVRQREMQDLLLLRGVNLAKHRFSGASQVVVRRGGVEKEKAEPEAVSSSSRRRAERMVAEAIATYLNENVSEERPWTIDCRLDDDQIRQVTAIRNKVTINGGLSPWTGNQRFDVAVESPDEAAVRFSLPARVSLPPAVVVATRPLPRGAVISGSDIRLDHSVLALTERDVLHSIEDAIGQEVVRAVAAGVIVDREAVRAPLLVRRGEIVTVAALGAGIRIRTNARAKNDGSLGELIAVESLQNRETYFARVCGLRSVEVYSGVMQSQQK